MRRPWLRNSRARGSSSNVPKRTTRALSAEATTADALVPMRNLRTPRWRGQRGGRARRSIKHSLFKAMVDERLMMIWWARRDCRPTSLAQEWHPEAPRMTAVRRRFIPRFRLAAVAALATSTILWVAQSAEAGAGDLDTSFGGSGFVRYPFDANE